MPRFSRPPRWVVTLALANVVVWSAAWANRPPDVITIEATPRPSASPVERALDTPESPDAPARERPAAPEPGPEAVPEPEPEPEDEPEDEAPEATRPSEPEPEEPAGQGGGGGGPEPSAPPEPEAPETVSPDPSTPPQEVGS